MDNRKLYLDADRFEDIIACKIEEIWNCDDKGDANIATIQGAWVSALEWVQVLIADESETVSDHLADRIEEYTETNCKECENRIVCEVHGWDCEELAEMHREYEEREVL